MLYVFNSEDQSGDESSEVCQGRFVESTALFIVLVGVGLILTIAFFLEIIISLIGRRDRNQNKQNKRYTLKVAQGSTDKFSAESLSLQKKSKPRSSYESEMFSQMSVPTLSSVQSVKPSTKEMTVSSKRSEQRPKPQQSAGKLLKKNPLEKTKKSIEKKQSIRENIKKKSAELDPKKITKKEVVKTAEQKELLVKKSTKKTPDAGGISVKSKKFIIPPSYDRLDVKKIDGCDLLDGKKTDNHGYDSLDGGEKVNEPGYEPLGGKKIAGHGKKRLVGHGYDLLDVKKIGHHTQKTACEKTKDAMKDKTNEEKENDKKHAVKKDVGLSKRKSKEMLQTAEKESEEENLDKKSSSSVDEDVNKRTPVDRHGYDRLYGKSEDTEKLT